MDRITDRDLDRRIDTVNSLLGFPEDTPYAPGTVHTDHAYGAVSVVLFTEGGGRTELHSRGTKREAFLFLNGLIKGLDMARKRV